MFNFNLKQAAIYPALKWEGVFDGRGTRRLKALALTGFILSAVIFLASFLQSYGQNIPFISSLAYYLPRIGVLDSFFPRSAGLLMVFFSSWAFFLVFQWFFKFKLKRPSQIADLTAVVEQPDLYNLAQFFSFESSKAILSARRLAKKLNCPVDSSLLFYFLLTGNSRLHFVFNRALIDIDSLGKRLADYMQGLSAPRGANKKKPEEFTLSFQTVILDALKGARKNGRTFANIGDILVALSRHDTIFQKVLLEYNLKTEDIENLVWWLETIEGNIAQRSRVWDIKNLAKAGTMGQEWAAGYTLTLDQYSSDLTLAAGRANNEVIGHQKEIEAVEAILSRSDINDVLLVGEPGSGRRSVIQAVSRRSFLGQGAPAIKYKRVVEIDLVSLLARMPDMEKAEETLDAVFREAISAGNVILVIDEFHNYIGVKSQPGKVDISAILGRYLPLPQFQFIGIASYEGLHKNIEQNSSILNLFEKVEVSEVSALETLMLLENFALDLERKHKKLISQPAMREVIRASGKFFPNLTFPKKALDLLDEVAAFVATSTRDYIVTPKHVADVVSEKTEIPIGDLAEKEKAVLLKLEELIHQRLVNQDEAVSEISEALRRARAEVSAKKGPMGGFLFLGPTGVGKTETAKALAEIYFGSEARMIRLDMSEFQSVEDIPRLLGKEGQEGLLSTPVREKPFALVLLDEFEKAHPNILNLFLQVLDEGHITDGQGRKVSFQNCIIIATSNAGYQLILEAVKNPDEWGGVKQKLLDELFNKAIFRPELINRFDAVVVFKPLTMDNLLAVAGLLLGKMAQNLKEKNIEFIVSDKLKAKIAELSYSPVFGAREMRRVVQDKVENVLAKALLSNQLGKGDRVEIDTDTFELKITHAA